MKKIRFRRMADEDVEAVSRLEEELFSRPWSRQGFLDAIAQKDTIFAVAEDQEGVLAGYCGMYCSLDEGEITNVAVAREYGSRGIGQSMLRYLLESAKEMGVDRVILEVRISNQPAIHLYEKIGFQSQGIRRDFYESPREDGYVMLLHQ